MLQKDAKFVKKWRVTPYRIHWYVVFPTSCFEDEGFFPHLRHLQLSIFDLLENYDRLTSMRFIVQGPLPVKKLNLWDNQVVLQLFAEKLLEAFALAVIRNVRFAEHTSTPFVSWGSEVLSKMLELLETDEDQKTFLVVTNFEAHFVLCVVVELTYATRVICSKPVNHPMIFPNNLRGNFFVWSWALKRAIESLTNGLLCLKLFIS